MLEMGRMVAGRALEREEVAEPDSYPTDTDLRKWANEEGLL